MCGIAGIYSRKYNQGLRSNLQKMTDCMQHRGPDADGFYQDGCIGLGHRRLAIIDLSDSANQPLFDQSGRYIIVFNGEIYNFQEVKQDAGMSEYQIRGWRAWHHHMALVIYAQGYILSEKKLFENEMPFLSAYDLREVIMQTYAIKGKSYDEIVAQIKQRHRQRKADLIRNNVKT